MTRAHAAGLEQLRADAARERDELRAALAARAQVLEEESRSDLLLAASVGELPDKPPPKGVSTEHHTSILPATAQFPGFPTTAVATGIPA